MVDRRTCPLGVAIRRSDTLTSQLRAHSAGADVTPVEQKIVPVS